MSDWPHAKITPPREIIAAADVMALLGVAPYEAPPPPIHVDPNVATLTVTTVAVPANGGTASGDGLYEAGATATVYATPSLHHNFVNWTYINGLEASREATYSFVISTNTTLNARFEYAPLEYPTDVPWNIYRNVVGHMNSANISRKVTNDYVPPQFVRAKE